LNAVTEGNSGMRVPKHAIIT